MRVGVLGRAVGKFSRGASGNLICRGARLCDAVIRNDLSVSDVSTSLQRRPISTGSCF